MRKITNSIPRLHLLVALVFMILFTNACARVEPSHSSCEYLITLLKDEQARRAIEYWLENIYDNPDKWQKKDGGRFRGMGAFYISIPDPAHLKNLGLPEHTQLLASKDADGNVTRVVAAVAQWVGIIFSKDKRFIDVGAVPEGRSERIGVLCLNRDQTP